MRIRHGLAWIGKAGDAATVAAATRAMPRSACKARTTGPSGPSASAASMGVSKRPRRAVAASMAAMQSAKTRWRAGCSDRRSARQRRCRSVQAGRP